MPRPLPEVSVSCERSKVSSVGGPSGRSQEPLAWVEATDKHVASDSLHVSVHQTTVEPTAPEDASPQEVSAFPKEGGAGLCHRGGWDVDEVWVEGCWASVHWEHAWGRWSLPI